MEEGISFINTSIESTTLVFLTTALFIKLDSEFIFSWYTISASIFVSVDALMNGFVYSMEQRGYFGNLVL